MKLIRAVVEENRRRVRPFRPVLIYCRRALVVRSKTAITCILNFFQSQDACIVAATTPCSKLACRQASPAGSKIDRILKRFERIFKPFWGFCGKNHLLIVQIWSNCKTNVVCEYHCLPRLIILHQSSLRAHRRSSSSSLLIFTGMPSSESPVFLSICSSSSLMDTKVVIA